MINKIKFNFHKRSTSYSFIWNYFHAYITVLFYHIMLYLYYWPRKHHYIPRAMIKRRSQQWIRVKHVVIGKIWKFHSQLFLYHCVLTMVAIIIILLTSLTLFKILSSFLRCYQNQCRKNIFFFINSYLRKYKKN